ncbi:TetR/AcrR family transcriptional regulator [Paenibacillus thalictri]|uniref:TetR/AcrR family transcriptional regulator n=1 Tax=Paenibacillus thalictri TaxID=2527873 RepID=A0A4Q9DMR6_9BACL|nr:TetR/AcrR family transcriptional regulator [Paenibacillus thalictri]TBL76640.1 TetR/AcrR family transcriptional regulator [Paenibacillus thalictri]
MSPRTKEQNQAIRDRRISQIRHTAAEVFLEKGLRMEMGDIAEKAGLGRGTVYHYYNNKLELFEELLREAFQRSMNIIRETLQTEEAPEARLMNYVRAKLRSWVQEPMIFIMFLFLLQSTDPIPVSNPAELQREMEQLMEPVLDVIKQGITAGTLVAINPETMYKTLFGTLIGTANIFIRKNNIFGAPDQDTWINDVVYIVFNGFRNDV